MLVLELLETIISGCVALGYQSLYNGTIGGSDQTAIGREALRHLGSGAGNENTAIGAYAGYYNTSGSYNSFIGANSGYNQGSDYNTLIGFQAGYNSSSLRSGDNNTFIGTQSGYNNEGSNNLYIGHKAGYNSGSETNTLRIANQYATLIKGGFSSGNLYLGRDDGTGTITIYGNADIDGTLETDALSINSTTVTSTAAELNILDGVTSTTAELNILDGVTSTTAELNILDGVTSTTAELNILDGVTASATDINLIDGITNGTVAASKAIVTDANKDISGGRNITITGELDADALDISGDTDIDGTLTLGSISNVESSINTNTSNISTNTSNISTNSSAISTINSTTLANFTSGTKVFSDSYWNTGLGTRSLNSLNGSTQGLTQPLVTQLLKP